MKNFKERQFIQARYLRLVQFITGMPIELNINSMYRFAFLWTLKNPGYRIKPALKRTDLN